MHKKRFRFYIGIFLLVSFLFRFPSSIQAAEYYVNGTAGNDTLGDGSDQNPWKTISYGSSQVTAGDTLCLQSGTYNEYVNVNSNGLPVVPITYNVSVSGNRVTFPSGTALSNVQTNGQDYVYIFRSKVSNNGVFPIVGKGGTYVQIESQLIEEQGSPGDEMKLSAAIGRPVLITNCSQKPEDEPVITGSGSGFYMEKKDFNILDGITIRNSLQSFNMQYGGNYNVIQNCTVDTITDMNGIQIGQSTASYPNTYNIIANNTIYNPMVEGIYIGAGGQGEAQNHTDFTHIIDNEIYTSGGVKELENAIDLKEHNKGSVVEGNNIHDIVLMTGGNAVIDVRDNHTDVWIYNNVFTNIQTDVLYRSVFMTYPTERLEIFNNILYNPTLDPVNETFTWMSKGGSGSSVDFYNNTIHNLARGFWMENSGGTYRMHNNIFSGVEGDYLRQWNDSGNLILKNNVFTADPNWTPSNNALEIGRIISSNVRFYDAGSGNFSIQEGSVAIDAGTTDLYAPRDRLLRFRSLPPDIGAYEEHTHTPPSTPIPSPTITITPTSSCSVSFSDVSADDTFSLPITNLACDTIISGFEDGTFKPDQSLTRAQMAKFIRRAFSVPANTSCTDFPDVPSDNIFYTEITSLKCSGVIGGFKDGSFKPDLEVTRGQAMKFVMNGLRYAKSDSSYLAYTGIDEPFSDVSGDNTFYEVIMAAAANDIVNGYENGTFQPQSPTSRGAMSKMVDFARKK